jgi:hypothetical protein
MEMLTVDLELLAHSHASQNATAMDQLSAALNPKIEGISQRCKSSAGTASRTCRFLLRHFSKAIFSSASDSPSIARSSRRPLRSVVPEGYARLPAVWVTVAGTVDTNAQYAQIFYPLHPRAGQRLRIRERRAGPPATYYLTTAEGEGFAVPVWMTAEAAADVRYGAQPRLLATTQIR